MGSRLKEDERNERAIRSLLKLPANKKCINCNSLGPQYVCTNFWTFVCTTCSGIHREFTHRVKSVSMAKFTSQEVAALQSGGNERARSIYFKEWDTQRHSYPNSSNIDRLRDFIRHVYVDRRFSGEKSSEKPPRGHDSFENKSDAFQGGSRSPPFEDRYDRRRNDRPSPGGRSDDSYSKYDDKSPEHSTGSRYSSDQGRSPNRPEIVNDCRREDRFANARNLDGRRTSDVDSLSDGRSPDHQKDKDINMSSPPAVRPVRELLGDDVIPLKIDPPKPNGILSEDAPAHVKRTASSSSFGSYDGNHVEPKKETLGSLIDFDADPEPAAAVAAASNPQTEQTNSVLTTIQPTTNGNWASFDFATEAKVPQVSSTSSNTLDSLFTQLITPSSNTGQSGQSHNYSAPLLAPGGGASKPDVHVDPFPMPSLNAEGFTPASTTISTGVSFDSMNASGSGPSMQQQPSNFPSAHLPQPVSKTSHNVVNGSETHLQKAETKSSERNPLPEDLFAATYHQHPTAPQGWHTGHPAGMGFAMQYSVPASTHNFQQPAKSSNPFDFSNESSPPPAQSQTDGWSIFIHPVRFPSMAPLQGAMPTVPQPSTGLVNTSNIGASYPAYMQPQLPSYTTQVPPPYATERPSEAYFGQQPSQTQSMSSIRPPAVGMNPDSSFFAPANPNQIMGGGYPAPAAPNSYMGGNPFG